jgi:septal ring factor EnvC (AmiA/AmiB activator)
VPDPLGTPPDWASVAGFTAIVGGVGAVTGAVLKQVLDFLASRAAGQDAASFRAHLLAQVEHLSQQVGTYEEQVDAMEADLVALRSANERLTREFQAAANDRDELDRTVRALGRRVRQLERRNTLYAATLTQHGIPVPPDGEPPDDADDDAAWLT